jgi:hypothetical protein
MDSFVNVGSFILGVVATLLFCSFFSQFVTTPDEALNKYMDASQKDCYTRKEIEIIQQDK